MKKLSYILVTFFVILTLSWIPYRGSSQTFERDTKLSKQEKKEARKAELFRNYKAIGTLIDQKQFVLEASFLQNRYGDQIPVTSMINFVMVDTPNVVIQTGNAPTAGYNGLGGVTAEGSIANWTVTADPDRMNYSVFFSTMTNLGTYDVIVRITADASATATITGTSSGRLTYRGNLVALYNSKVYKGQRTL